LKTYHLNQIDEPFIPSLDFQSNFFVKDYVNSMSPGFYSKSLDAHLDVQSAKSENLEPLVDLKGDF